MFRIVQKKKHSFARIGKLTTQHGVVETPVFMPIATSGAIKTLTPKDAQDVGAKIILGNTYHLYLRPGVKVIQKSNGIHRFMNWSKSILTDSGGYQVFSLGAGHRQKNTKPLVRITSKGVWFRSHLNGDEHFLTPEKVIDIQLSLGSDILMVLDECPPYPTSQDYAEKSRKLTAKWALRSFRHFQKQIQGKKRRPLIFGIVQGATYEDIRHKSAEDIVAMPFDGYALGGLAVGEKQQVMYRIVSSTVPLLPEEKPRYLMGVGMPEDIIEAVRAGIDMFDCVLPTRNARHGQIFIWRKKVDDIFTTKDFYDCVHITNKRFTQDIKQLDSQCACYTCKNFGRAYLNHLFRSGELLGLRLATIHNLTFYFDLIHHLRRSIKNE